jgi:Zn-dependent protease with chaperone function
MTYRQIIGFSSVTLCLCISIAACDKVNLTEVMKVGGQATEGGTPGGGQTGLANLPIPQQLLSNLPVSVPPSVVAKLGNGFYNWEISRKENEKETTPKVTEQMTRIFDLLKAAALSDQTYGTVAKEMDWQLNTLKENIAMAKAFPGGGIVIYDGVFPIAKNEDALAAILGHEMAHVLKQHEVKRLTGDVAVAAATLGPAIASGMGKVDPKVIGPVAGALGVGYLFGVRPHWQQSQELEADCLGLELAAKAGYDPEKVKGFWRRMMDIKDKNPNAMPEFLNDHPIDKDRLNHIENQCMPTAKKDFAEVVKNGKEQKFALLPGEEIS